MSNTPTDAEIEKLAAEHLKAFSQFPMGGQVWFEGEVEFARAVLAKWAAPQQEAQEPVATLHCNDVGYVWARATEVGKLMRFEKPLNLYTAPQPAPAPLSESIDQVERALAIIGVVGAIDGHDVVRRESVLEIARRAAPAAQGGKA